MNAMSDQPLPRSTRAIYATFDFLALRKHRILDTIIVGSILVGIASGFHVVKKEQAGVVVRFGRVVQAHTSPGIHYHIPILDKVQVRAVRRIASHRISSNAGGTTQFTILSGDPNLFEVDVVLQYTISNLGNFLFASTDPLGVVTVLVREHLVDQMGRNFIDLIFTTNREIIERHLFNATMTELKNFDVGIELVALSIVDVRPIDETVEAFRDVSDAIAESIQAVSNANRRKEKLLLRTQGQADALLQSARARARERRLQAHASASAFNDLLRAYRAEPAQVAITRYWDRMRAVFATANLAAVNPSNTGTVEINMIDGLGGPGHKERLAGDARPDMPLLSTGDRLATHGLESTADRGLLDGQFHRRGTERDHKSGASPSSLLFDTLSIFDHVDVSPQGQMAAQQAQVPTMTEGGPEPESDAGPGSESNIGRPGSATVIDVTPLGDPPVEPIPTGEKGGANAVPTN